jgi:hypothetical protein
MELSCALLVWRIIHLQRGAHRLKALAMATRAPAVAGVAAMLLSGCAATMHGPPPVCIESYRIDHTEVPDDSQILFHMNDGSVYRAAIQGNCSGLHIDTRGFTYQPIPGNNEICSNLQTIRLNTYQSVCLIGDISLIKAARR